METRSLPITFELKAVEGRVIEGYAAAWARDRVNDIIDAKAFDRTLIESPDVAVFVGHDASRLPVGEPIEMRADSHGLFTRSSIYQTADGDALLEVARKRLANGRTLGMSIGFRTVKDRWDSKQKARVIEDLDLVEYSFLASPALAANPQAQTTAVKRNGPAVHSGPFLGSTCVCDECLAYYAAHQDDFKPRARKDTSAGTVITYEDSYEDLSDDLEDAAEELLGVPYVTVVATFPGHVVVAASGIDDVQFWDIPYTLDADHEPQLGQPTELDQAWVPANAKMRADLESKPYRIQRQDGKYCVVGGSSGSRNFGCHATRAEATAQMRALYANEGKETPVKVMTAEMKAALPDSAFAFVEDGGTKDDGGLTTPRSKRHFVHHTADGSVDIGLLQQALHDAGTSPHGSAEVLGHLMRHALKADLKLWATDRTDDAHNAEWTHGAAPVLLALAAKMGALAETMVADQHAMNRLGIGTKDGHRLNVNLRTELKAIHEGIGSLIAKADEIERGEDGTALVEMYRTAFDLLSLEEVA